MRMIVQVQDERLHLEERVRQVEKDIGAGYRDLSISTMTDRHMVRHSQCKARGRIENFTLFAILDPRCIVRDSIKPSLHRLETHIHPRHVSRIRQNLCADVNRDKDRLQYSKEIGDALDGAISSGH